MSDCQMEWPSLLSPKRYPASTKIGNDLPYNRSRPPWQQDYDRIIFSSAFRRLQDKTQVHPLSGSDYVRTRLTHSLEVSSVARSLGTLAGNHIVSKHGGEQYQQSTLRESLSPLDVGMITSAAALAHDLGNPPFGHSGEDAIRFWFATSPVAEMTKENLTKEQIADFDNWEGNAEGFRILSRLQMNRNSGGMRLTAATLGAFMKYPQSAEACRLARQTSMKTGEKLEVSRKKPGMFNHDIDLWSQSAEEMGLNGGRADKSWSRHPLAFVTEAADDICYRIVDLEDGFRLGLLTFEELRDLIHPLLSKSEEGIDARLKAQHDLPSKASYLRAMAIGNLIVQVDEAFRGSETQLLCGTMNIPLLSVTESFPHLELIGKFTKERVYSAANVIQIEAAGFEIIPGLLDLFVDALETMAGNIGGTKSLRAKKLAQLMPGECLGVDGLPADDPYLRLLDAVDFVAGMTDTFALDLFRKLRGVTVPR